MHPKHFRESVIIHLKNTFGVDKIRARQFARMAHVVIRRAQDKGAPAERVAERLNMMMTRAA